MIKRYKKFEKEQYCMNMMFDDDNLNEDKLWILLNIYYKTIYEELEDNRISINKFNEWI